MTPESFDAAKPGMGQAVVEWRATLAQCANVAAGAGQAQQFSFLSKPVGVAGVFRVIRSTIFGEVDGNCGTDVHFISEFFKNIPGIRTETITTRQVSNGPCAERVNDLCREQAQLLRLQFPR